MSNYKHKILQEFLDSPDNLRQFHLSLGQFELLKLIGNRVVTSSQIAKELGVELPSAQQKLKRLAKKGYILAETKVKHGQVMYLYKLLPALEIED